MTSDSRNEKPAPALDSESGKVPKGRLCLNVRRDPWGGPHIPEAWLEVRGDGLLYAYRLSADGDHLEIVEQRMIQEQPKKKSLNPLPLGDGREFEQSRTRKPAEVVAEVASSMTTRQTRGASPQKAVDLARQLYREIEKVPSPVLAHFPAFTRGREGERTYQQDNGPVAEIAAIYAGLVEQGHRSPTAETAKRTKRGPGGVSKLLRKARDRDILTPSPGRGKSGGKLTAYGEQLRSAE